MSPLRPASNASPRSESVVDSARTDGSRWMNSNDLCHSRGPICENARPDGVSSGIPSSSSVGAAGISGIEAERPVAVGVDEAAEGYFAGSRGGSEPEEPALRTSMFCDVLAAVFGFGSSSGVGVILLMCLNREESNQQVCDRVIVS